MGTAGEVDTHASVDVNTVTGEVHYGWVVGTTSPSGDLYKPECRWTRDQYSAVVVAAQVSQAAWQAHLQTHWPARWAWLSAQGSTIVNATYEADRLICGIGNPA